jgi:hypothetical protein
VTYKYVPSPSGNLTALEGGLRFFTKSSSRGMRVSTPLGFHNTLDNTLKKKLAANGSKGTFTNPSFEIKRPKVP